MGGPREFPATAWSLLPHQSTLGYISSVQTGEDSSAKLFTLSYIYSNTLMERTERRRNPDSVNVIKMGPRGKTVTFIH